MLRHHISAIASLLIAASVDAATPTATSSSPVESPRVDVYGDPLPNGAVARLGTMRFRPGQRQESALSIDGKLLATGNKLDWQDSTKKLACVTLWDMSTGLPIAKIEIVGSNEIERLQFRTDGKQLAVASSSCWTQGDREQRKTRLGIIDLHTRKMVNELSDQQLDGRDIRRIAHFDTVKGMLVETLLERQTGITGGDDDGDDIEPEWERTQDQPILLWRPEANELLKFYREGEEFFIAPEGRLFSVTADQIRLIDPRSEKVLSEWERPSRAALPACVSSDGKVLAATCPRRVRDGERSTRSFHEVVLCENGKAPRIIHECKWSWDFDHASFCKNDQYIVAMNDKEQVAAWRVDSGKQIWITNEVLEYRLQGAYRLHPSGDRLAVFTYSPLNKGAAAYAPTIKIVEVENGQVAAKRFFFGAEDVEWTSDGTKLVAVGMTVGLLNGKTLRDETAPSLHGHSGEPLAFSVSPNQRWVASTDWSGNLFVWDHATGKLAVPLDSVEPLRISNSAFVDDGNRIAMVTVDSHLRIYDCDTRRLLHDIPLVFPATSKKRNRKVQNVAFNADGSRLAVVSDDGVEVWDTRLGVRIHRLHGENTPESEVAFSTNGNTVVLRDVNRTTFQDGSDAKPSLTLSSLQRAPLSFTTDGNRFAYLQGDSVHVWDINETRIVFSSPAFKGDNPRFQIAPLGDQLVMYDEVEKMIRVADVKTGRELRSMKDVQWASFHFEKVPPELLLADIRQSDKHRLVDLASGRTLAEWTPSHNVWSISHDGRVIALGHHDIELIEAASGRKIGTIPGKQSGVMSLAFSAGGRTLITGGRDTTALVWDWASACNLQSDQPRRVEEAWSQLRADDAARGYSAILALKASPREAMAMLRQELQSIEADETQRIGEWIGQLDHDRYSTRANAQRELGYRGRTIRAALESALRRPASAEAERRLRALLEAMGTQKLSPDEIRIERAIQALEWIDTPESRNTIRALASGDLLIPTTQSASAALRRQQSAPSHVAN